MFNTRMWLFFLFFFLVSQEANLRAQDEESFYLPLKLVAQAYEKNYRRHSFVADFFFEEDGDEVYGFLRYEEDTLDSFYKRIGHLFHTSLNKKCCDLMSRLESVGFIRCKQELSYQTFSSLVKILPVKKVNSFIARCCVATLKNYRKYCCSASGSVCDEMNLIDRYVLVITFSHDSVIFTLGCLDPQSSFFKQNIVKKNITILKPSSFFEKILMSEI